MDKMDYTAWAYECEKRRCEIYKDMFLTERKKTAELVKEVAEEQTKRIVTEFRFAESENHKKLADIQNKIAEQNKRQREDRKALRKFLTWMFGLMTVWAVIMYLCYAFSIPKLIIECMMIAVGCVGTALGYTLGEIARRITV